MCRTLRCQIQVSRNCSRCARGFTVVKQGILPKAHLGDSISSHLPFLLSMLNFTEMKTKRNLPLQYHKIPVLSSPGYRPIYLEHKNSSSYKSPPRIQPPSSIPCFINSIKYFYRALYYLKHKIRKDRRTLVTLSLLDRKQ